MRKGRDEKRKEYGNTTTGEQLGCAHYHLMPPIMGIGR